MSEVKSIPELKKELKLNRWKSAKCKVLRNANITKNILKLIWPFFLGASVIYVCAGFVIGSFTFPFEEGTMTKSDKYKYVKINKDEYQEDKSEFSSKDGIEQNAITIYEKPELMEDGIYRLIRRIYSIEDGVSGEELKGINADRKNKAAFDYDKAFGQPTVLTNETRKPKIDKKYITAYFIAYYEVEVFKRHEDKGVVYFLMIFVGVLTASLLLFVRDVERILCDIENSGDKAKKKLGLNKTNKEIKKALAQRKKELKGINTSTYSDVVYSEADLYTILEENANDYKTYLNRSSLSSYDKSRLKYYGQIITKEEKTYSSKYGELLSTRVSEYNTGEEISSGNGVLVLDTRPIHETSDISPKTPDESIQKHFDYYSADSSYGKRVVSAKVEGKKIIGNVTNDKDLEDKALELLKIRRKRK